MASNFRKLAGELVVCGFFGGVGWLALAGLEGLTKSPFDYLGSAEVPRVLAWLVILFAVLVAISITLKAISQPNQADKIEPLPDNLADLDLEEDAAGTRQVWQTALMIVATFLYIVSILWTAIPYSVSTSVFLIVGMLCLTPPDKRKWQIIVPLSIFIGALGEYIFVSVLLLPFPGW